MIRFVARVLEAPLAQRDRELDARDAIVVLGARLGPGDVLTEPLVERVATAVALYRAGAAPRIVATGGVTGRATRAEADAIADALVTAGIASDVIAVERAAQTTIENARFTARLLRANDTFADASDAAGGASASGASAAHVAAANARVTSERSNARPRVWLVTQPFHARRSERIFRRAGFDADAWHIADSMQYRDRGRAVKWLAREWAAWSRELFRR